MKHRYRLDAETEIIVDPDSDWPVTKRAGNVYTGLGYPESERWLSLAMHSEAADALGLAAHNFQQGSEALASAMRQVHGAVVAVRSLIPRRFWRRGSE